jgi:hypothetical protein
MRGTSHLCCHEQGPDRLWLGTDEFIGKHFETVERRQITDELRCQLLLLDNQLRDARLLRRAPESIPGPLARTLQIDDGDVAISHRKTQGAT